MIKRINFPKTSNNYFLNLENKCFDFCNDNKPANIIIFIGRNGCGKSSLLINIFKNLYYENRNDSWKEVESIQFSNKYMFLEHDRNGINYSINVLFKPLSNPINLNSIPIMRAIGPDIYDTNTSVTLREKFICRYGKEIDQNLIKRSYAVLQLIPSQTISDETKKVMRDKWIFVKSAYLNIRSLISNDKIANNLFNNAINEKLKTTWFHKINEKFRKNCLIELSDDNSVFLYVKKNGKIFDFNFLSQGEKQFLHFLFKIILDNLDNPITINNEIFLFYDELETSLHNELQKAISEQIIIFSNSLLNKKIGHQFFISTHSPFVVEKFLNKENVVIIDVENNGENIVKNKNLLLRYDEKKFIKLVYDEVLYYYYHISTTNYFIMLYEKIKHKLKNDKEILEEFEKMGKKIMIIQCIDDKLKNSRLQKKNEGENDLIYEISKNDISSQQSSLTRFRNLLAHYKNEFNYKVFKLNNNEQWWNEQTINFYDDYEKRFNILLTQQIELARHLLMKSKLFNN